VVPEIDPIIPRRRLVNDPAAKSNARIVESSIDVPIVNDGFEDGGDEQQETPPR
jgi:hypothetical protein